MKPTGIQANLFEYLRVHGTTQVGRPVFHRPDGRPVSYRTLLRRSSRMADALRHLGIRSGARVAVQVNKGEDFLALYLGALSAGAVFVPLNPTSTPEEVAYFLEDCQAALLVCRPERRSEMREAALRAGTPQVLTLASDGRSESFQGLARSALRTPSPAHAGRSERARTIGDTADTEAPDERNLAAILYTSGTTGRPKGAMLTHENIIANVEALHEFWGWQPTDVLLHALPLFHIHGLFVAATVALRAGASMILLPRFDGDAVRRLLPQATVFMGVPTMYHRLAADEGLTPDLCARVRLFACGSAPLPSRDFKAFHRRTGHTILERYGMTETGIIASNPLHGLRKAGSVGVPLPGVEVRLVDSEDFRPVPEGQPGEIWVRGPSVFVGYFGKPEATAQAFVDGWFRTGDLARRDPDGCYEIVGRLTDVIITGGLNVYPAEVEAVLNQIEGVEESAVVGLPDEDLGERVTAVIVPTRHGSSLTADDVTQALRARLAPYKCPRRVEFVDSFPRNPMGKVEKAQIRRALAGT